MSTFSASSQEYTERTGLFIVSVGGRNGLREGLLTQDEVEPLDEWQIVLAPFGGTSCAQTYLAVRLVRVRRSEHIRLERRASASREEGARSGERQTIRKLRICGTINLVVLLIH